MTDTQQLLCNNTMSNGWEEQMNLPWVIHLNVWKCLHPSFGRATHLEIDILETLVKLTLPSMMETGP